MILDWSNYVPEAQVVGYKIYRSTSPQGLYDYPADANLIATVNGAATKTYNDPVLSDNQTYFYKVAPVDACGQQPLP